MQCEVENCEREGGARTRLCPAHYQQKRNGKPFTPIRRCLAGLPLQERIRTYSDVIPSTGCWEWNAYRKPSGYGTLAYDGKPYYHAHRVSYLAFIGVIPDGMSVLHRCDNRACVNPEHLFLGSNQDNVDDRNRKRRQATGDQVGTSKLTWQQVRSIKTQLAGNSNKSLAKWFGVHPTTIANIRNGVSWRGSGPTTVA